MYFLNYGLAKRRLDKYLKSVVAQFSSRDNMLKALKIMSNHRGDIFIILIDNQ